MRTCLSTIQLGIRKTRAPFGSTSFKRWLNEIRNTVDSIDLKNDIIITEKFKQLRDDYKKPRYPIVLCHGFSGFDRLSLLPQKGVNKGTSTISKTVGHAIKDGFMNLDYWYGIHDAIEKLGCTVLIAKVPPFGTIEERASCLNDFIDAQCESIQKTRSKSSIYNLEDMSKQQDKEINSYGHDGKIKVNLVSHSMGGLDSRFMICKLKQRNFSVVTLTTVSTPHHGSECADFIVDYIDSRPFLKKICPKSIHQLTTTYLEKFNREVIDDPQVSYFSYGANFNPRWFNVFNLSWKIIKHRVEMSKKESKDYKNLIANDGMVSVRSSKWGEYLGTLEGVDHLDLINWTNRTRTVVDKVLFQKTPSFNAIALYLDICDKLAKRGF